MKSLVLEIFFIVRYYEKFLLTDRNLRLWVGTFQELYSNLRIFCKVLKYLKIINQNQSDIHINYYTLY